MICVNEENLQSQNSVSTTSSALSRCTELLLVSSDGRFSSVQDADPTEQAAASGTPTKVYLEGRGGCSPRLTGLSLSHSSGRYSPRLKYKTKRLLKQLFPRLLSSRRLRLPPHLLSCSSPLSSTHHPPPLLSLSWSHVSPCSPPSCPPPPPSLLPHCPPLSS